MKTESYQCLMLIWRWWGAKLNITFQKTLHIRSCDSLQLCAQQKNEDGRPGGGGIEEIEEPYQGAGVGEEQEGDGGLEQEVKEEWLPSHHEARGD